MFISRPLEKAFEFSKKSVKGSLPVLDVTDRNISVAEIRTRLGDLDSDELLDLLTLRDSFPQIEEQISRNLGRKRELALICSLFLRDYSSTNGLRRMLLFESSREVVLEVLNDLKSQSTFPQVRGIEEKQIKTKNKLLFTPDCDDINCFCKNQMKLDQYNNARSKLYPEFKARADRKSGSISKKTERMIDQTLEELMFTYQRKIQAYIDEMIVQISRENPAIKIHQPLSTVKVKSKDSILRKMKEKGYSFDKMTDLLRGRIIINSLRDMEAVVKIIEQESGLEILEKDNKFIDPNHRAPYRAIHYVIKINNKYCFELQLKTFPELILSEMDHDVIKEDKYRLSNNVKERLTQHYWGLQKKLLLEYINSP